MSFYMSTNGQLHPYNFNYLEGGFPKPRLEKTAIHSEVKKETQAPRLEKQIDFYAINVMTTSIVTEDPNTSLDKIKELMKKFGMHHIPISSDNKLLGIISDRDLLKINKISTFYFLRAKNIMTTVLIVCDEETPLSHIAKVLLEEKISCLPVINKDKKLTGIISRSDILRTIIENRLVLQ